jgi:hypothetical protein
LTVSVITRHTGSNSFCKDSVFAKYLFSVDIFFIPKR